MGFPCIYSFGRVHPGAGISLYVVCYIPVMEPTLVVHRGSTALLPPGIHFLVFPRGHGGAHVQASPYEAPNRSPKSKTLNEALKVTGKIANIQAHNTPNHRREPQLTEEPEAPNGSPKLRGLGVGVAPNSFFACSTQF